MRCLLLLLLLFCLYSGSHNVVVTSLELASLVVQASLQLTDLLGFDFQVLGLKG